MLVGALAVESLLRLVGHRIARLVGLPRVLDVLRYLDDLQLGLLLSLEEPLLLLLGELRGLLLAVIIHPRGSRRKAEVLKHLVAL